jgi:tetratricopeptide (TPR) repeat protein
MSLVLPPLRIYISGTHVDLHEHCTILIDTLLHMDDFPQELHFFGEQVQGDSMDEIARADLVVLLLAWHYGTVRPDGLSITHHEYREAVRLGKPILAFLADPATEAMDHTEDLFPAEKRDPDHRAQMHVFRQEVKNNGHATNIFDTPDNLAVGVAAALGHFILQRRERFTRRIPRNLPPRTPTFVGREHELAQLEADLRLGTHAAVAVSVAGVGGVGKSVLAAEIVARIADDKTVFPGGITWIRCNNQSGWEGVNAILTQLLLDWDITLSSEEFAGTSTPQQEAQIRAQALRLRLFLPGPALILLDHVERDLPIREITLLLTNLSITLLVTSRIPFSLPSLKYRNLEILAPDEALTLFRNHYLDKGGVWDETRDMDRTRGIVAPLQSSPLAIELASARAARLRTGIARLVEEFHTPDVLVKLSDPTDSTVNVHYMLGHSLEMLSDKERACFASLGMVSATDYPRDVLLALFSSLLEKHAKTATSVLELFIALSILQPFEDNGIQRAQIHPLLHEIAEVEWRAQSEQTQLTGIVGLLDGLNVSVKAHQQDFILFAHDEALYLEALSQAAWTGKHQREIIDLTWAIEKYLDLQGRWEIYNKILCFQLAACSDLGDRVGEGNALNNLGALAHQQGRYSDAEAYFNQALAIVRDLGDRVGEGTALNNLGLLAHSQEYYNEAEAYFAQALAIVRELGDRESEGWTLHNLGALAYSQGYYNYAAAYFIQSLTLLEPMGHANAALARENLEHVQQRLRKQQGARYSTSTLLADFTSSNGSAVLNGIATMSNTSPLPNAQKFRWPWQRRSVRH